MFYKNNFMAINQDQIIKFKFCLKNRKFSITQKFVASLIVLYACSLRGNCSYSVVGMYTQSTHRLITVSNFQLRDVSIYFNTIHNFFPIRYEYISWHNSC
jgi:hypothetical protein